MLSFSEAHLEDAGWLGAKNEAHLTSMFQEHLTTLV